MIILIIGLLLWIGVHLIPAIAPGVKQRWKGALGNWPYQGSFALLLAIALTLIIAGWKSTTPTYLYPSSDLLRSIALPLMLGASILFIASKAPTRIKQFIRHPQLTAVILWACAHLLTNGDSRSTLLFGNMLIWAVIEIVFINRRDGQWTKPQPATLAQDIVTLLIGIGLFIALVFLHPYLSGVPLRT